METIGFSLWLPDGGKLQRYCKSLQLLRREDNREKEKQGKMATVFFFFLRVNIYRQALVKAQTLK